MPVTAPVREIVQTMIGLGYSDQDFMALLDMEAKAAGHDMQPEDAEVTDGLS